MWILQRVAPVALALLLANCGGDSGKGAETDSSTTTTGVVATQEAAAESLENVESAVVQLLAKGTYVYPAVENPAWGGSGFIIDPEGIAVTNQHAVAGAATLEVLVSGYDEPVNARILGVSECSDLAVIDLEGDGYPYLKWYEGEVTPGLNVYAAGFPLLDPEFTLTRGIVSKAETPDFDSTHSYAQVVIEHDANIQPGNSGGPLVTENGQVVGVNFETRTTTSTARFFAIAVDEAQPIVETLRAGTDVDSLGVNGFALGEDTGVVGVWVASVESGSPAGELELRVGDVITKLEGLELATEGTMEEYCDILRTKGQDAALTIEVYRADTEETLKGEFNGEPLEPVAAPVPTVPPNGDEAAPTDGYTTITDDLGVIHVSVPASWSAIDGAPFEFDGVVAPNLLATIDIDTYLDPATSYGVSGLDILVFESAVGSSVQDMLGQMGHAASCTSASVDPYDDGLYAGSLELWTDCFGTVTGEVAVIAASPADASFVVGMSVHLVSSADFEALDEILATYFVEL